MYGTCVLYRPASLVLWCAFEKKLYFNQVIFSHKDPFKDVLGSCSVVASRRRAQLRGTRGVCIVECG